MLTAEELVLVELERKVEHYSKINNRNNLQNGELRYNLVKKKN